jgi:hypothetical protein
MRDQSLLITFEIPEIGALRSRIQQVAKDIRVSHVKLGSFKPCLAVPCLAGEQDINALVGQIGQREKPQHPLIVF